MHINKYELLEEVGSGGMAVVYRGRDTVLERDVAVKVMHPHLARNEDARKRFLREARAVARLHHPGIIEIYAYSGEDAPQEFIVTEFIRGKNLREFSRRNDLKSPEAAALICLELASALDHAHSNGVVHRDVKPDNVMVSYDSGLKIADFGIAHILESEHLTMTGAMLGSPAHMSPEQIEGRPSDSRSDIFSLGTILYWIAAGKLPFEGDSPTAMFRNIIEGRFMDPRAANHSVDNRMAAIISKMMAVRPEDRYQEMGQVKKDLEKWLKDSGLADFKAELKSLLKDPRTYISGLAERLPPFLRERAAAELKAGRYASAMDCCNRILALAPDDPVTLGLIKSADRRKLLGRVVLPAAAAVVLLAAAAALIAWHMNRGGPEPSTVPGPQGNAAAAPAQTWALEKAQPPARQAAAGQQDAKKPASGLRPFRTVQGTGKFAAKNINAGPRPVRIFVKPYADIYADGNLVGTDARDAVASLPPGKHRLEFRNRFFENQELAIDVPENGDPGEYRVELAKVRPAFLSVTSTPPAEIYINDAYKGTSTATVAEPVMVPMKKDRGSWTVHLKVISDGYKTLVQTVELQPGTTRNVKVKLEPK